MYFLYIYMYVCVFMYINKYTQYTHIYYVDTKLYYVYN